MTVKAVPDLLPDSRKGRRMMPGDCAWTLPAAELRIASGCPAFLRALPGSVMLISMLLTGVSMPEPCLRPFSVRPGKSVLSYSFFILQR